MTSKDFTEQPILGRIALLSALTVQAAGFETEDLTDVPGSQPVRELMLSGGADLTLECTGTARLTYLGHEQGIPDQQEQWQAVHDEDLRNGLTRGGPASLNNAYAMADGRIPALDLTVLEDDRQFFPACNAAPVFDTELLQEFPALEQVREPISAALTDDVMQELNRQVDVEGRDPADVAYEWMVSEGFIVEP